MNPLRYSIKNLKGNGIHTVYTVLILSCVISLSFLMYIVSYSLEQNIVDESHSYELVVTAEGSPMQGMMSSMLFIDKPLGNLPYSIYENLVKEKNILKAVPIGLGDTYKGFPIIGTNEEYFTPHRNGLEDRFQLKKGRYFLDEGEVVVGYEAAVSLNVKLNDIFYSSHGQETSEHKDLPYKVVGILSPTGRADDRGIFTSLESIWHVHHGSEKEVTSILIQPDNIGVLPHLKEKMDKELGVQAIYPTSEFRKLLSYFNKGLTLISFVVEGVILLSVLMFSYIVIQLYLVKKEEWRTLKIVGFTREKLINLYILEWMILGSLSLIVGIIICFGCMLGIEKYSYELIGFPMNLSIPNQVWTTVGIGISILIILTLFSLIQLRKK